MEVFWGYPWLIWTGKWATLGWQKPPLSVFTVLLLVGISFLATRLLINRSWSSLAIKLMITGLGLIVVLIAIRIEYGNGVELLSNRWFVYIGQIILNSFSNLNSIVLAFPAAAYFWWRGMLLGRRQDYNYIHSNVVFGAGSFVVLSLVWWATMGTGTFSDMAKSIGPYVAGFFFFGLAGTAFNNLHNVQKRMSPGETQPVSYGRWLPVVLGMVATIVTLGGIIATATSLDVAGFLKSLFGAISKYIQTVLYWLSFPLKYILMPFEWLARNFIEWLVRLFGVKPLQPQGEDGAGGQLPEIVPGTTPEEWLTVIKWALFIIVVIVVTVLIARSIEKNRRRRAETEPDFEETHESLWSWRALFITLMLFLKRLFGHFLPKKAVRRIVSSDGAIINLIEPPASTLKIREVFKHLLRDAEKAGLGRRRYETPFEYAQRFTEEIPDTVIPMHELTELYVHVRYSDVDAGSHQIVRANSLWRQIKELLKIRKTDQD